MTDLLDISSDQATSAHGGVLTIDLAALQRNYGRLRVLSRPAETGAAVKGNGYGLGLEPVARSLHEAGCGTFFVAHLSEAATLRGLLPPRDAVIYVLNGLLPGTGEAYRALDVRPVLGSPEEIAEWRAFAAAGDAPPAALHVDTGFNRLGLSHDEFKALAADRALLDSVDLSLIMSHLACADEPDDPMNVGQRDRFAAVRDALPGVSASLANSAGIYLGDDVTLDLARPGIALYGGQARSGVENPMEPVAALSVPVVQVRDVSAGDHIGYGATYRFARPARVALVSIGYADGFFRCLGSSTERTGGRLFVAGRPCPIVGRVSMDVTAIDVTGVPVDACGRGAMAEVIGPNQSVDDIARAAGTIGYEVLSRLGLRFSRVYSRA